DVLMTYEEDGDSGEESASDEGGMEETGEEEGSVEQESKEESGEKSEAGETSGESEDAGGKRDHEEPVPASPSTRRVAREKNVDIRNVEPSGKEGRVTTEDVEAAAGKAGGGEKEGKPGKKQQDR